MLLIAPSQHSLYRHRKLEVQSFVFFAIRWQVHGEKHKAAVRLSVCPVLYAVMINYQFPGAARVRFGPSVRGRYTSYLLQQQYL